MTDIQLAPGLIVDRCEWRISTFVARDAYIGYDFAGAPDDPATTTITERQVRAVNSVMRARMPTAPWGPLLGEALSELRLIPPELDLIDSDETSVGDGINVLTHFAMRLTEAKGLRDMGVSKVLHLVRPRFVAISDSYVRLFLGVPAGLPAHQSMREVQERVRALYLHNRTALDELHLFANSLPPVEGTGKLRVRTVPVRLSKLRILDILLWSKAATFAGPTGDFLNKNWGLWYTAELEQPDAPGLVAPVVDPIRQRGTRDSPRASHADAWQLTTVEQLVDTTPADSQKFGRLPNCECQRI